MTLFKHVNREQNQTLRETTLGGLILAKINFQED